MVQLVVGNNQRDVKGYLVDDIFIKISNLKYLSLSTIKSDSYIQGKYYGKRININGVVHRELFSIICYSNYISLLNRLVLSDIILNKIIFIQCSKYDLSGCNKNYGYINGLSYYVCIDTASFDVVAYLITTESLLHDDIHIAMLDVPNKRLGYGRCVVNSLLSLGKTLSGVSVVSALGFWEKVGAVYTGNNYFEII